MNSACSTSSSGGGGGSSSSLVGRGLLSTACPQGPLATSQGGGSGGQGKVPHQIREFLKSLDDQEWQSSLYSLLQSQTFNQVSCFCCTESA